MNKYFSREVINLFLNSVLIVAFSMTALWPAPTYAADENKVRTFLFQEFDANGVPKGWRDNTEWADLDKTFGSDRIDEEHQVAKIKVSAIRRGKFQMLGPVVSVKENRIYTIRIRMRSEPAMSVELGLREPKAPFKNWAVRKAFSTKSEWISHTVSFSISKSLPNYELFLSFSTPGTLWLDSIQILQESKEEYTERSARDEKAGNLLSNGEFRLSRYGWATYAMVDRQTDYPAHTGKQYSLEPPIFRTEQRDSDSVGVLKLTQWRSILLSDMFPVKIGIPFECMAKVRRTKGSGAVQFKLFSPSWNKLPSTSAVVGEEWTQLKLTGTAPFDLQLRCELAASSNKTEGNLEIAEVVVQQRPQTDPAKENPVFGVIADKEMPVYEIGEVPQLTALASGLGKVPQTVDWQLVDASDNVIRKGKWTVSNGGLSEKLKDIPVGWYQLRWQASWARNRSEGTLNIGVVPSTERVAAAQSPWGVHIEGSDLGLQKMKLLGARWLRLNNPIWMKWTAVQPLQDTWMFPDERVDKFAKEGIGLVGVLCCSPRWISRDPENDWPDSDNFGWKAALPREWGAWEEYVRQVVTRYKEKIQYWEIWNEPDIIFLSPPSGMTNAQAYLGLLSHAAPVIKAVDPKASVIASPAYVLHKRSSPEGYQPDFTERLIESGGLKYVDIFAIHHYFQPAERLFEHPEKYQEKLDAIRQAMRAAGQKPVLWDSEWGIINFTLASNGVELPSNNGMTGAQAAQELVVWSVGQLAAGLEKLFWYDCQDNFYLHFHVTKNFFDYRQPKPLFVAYAILTKALDGLTYKSSRMEADSIRVVIFQSEKEIVKVAYCPPGKVGLLKVDTEEKAVDYLGRFVIPDVNGKISLQNGPVYLMSKERLAMTLGQVSPVKNISRN